MSEIMPRIEYRRNEYGEPKRVHILQAGETVSLPKSNVRFHPGELAYVIDGIIVPFRYEDSDVFDNFTFDLKPQVQIMEYADETTEYVKCRYLSGGPIEIELPDPIIETPQYTVIKLSLFKRIKKWFKLRKLKRKYPNAIKIAGGWGKDDDFTYEQDLLLTIESMFDKIGEGGHFTISDSMQRSQTHKAYWDTTMIPKYGKNMKIVPDHQINENGYSINAFIIYENKGLMVYCDRCTVMEIK